HIGDRYNSFSRNARQIVPAGFHLVDFCHVRHGTAGTQVRKYDSLMRRAEDICALRHKMDATEHDEFCLFLLTRPGRQLEGIAAEVGKLNDIIALVVVTQNDQPLAQTIPNRTYSLIRLRIGKLAEALWQ